MKDFLAYFRECISENYIVSDGEKNLLKAPNEGIYIKIKSKGRYLLYEFDRNTGGTKLFPFFKEVPRLNAIADYVIIGIKQKTIHVLVIELKQKDGNPLPQIQATKHFMEYLIKSVSRIKKQDHSFYPSKMKLRGICYSKNSKGTTKMEVEYNKFGNTYLSGNVLWLESYLK